MKTYFMVLKVMTRDSFNLEFKVSRCLIDSYRVKLTPATAGWLRGYDAVHLLMQMLHSDF